MPRDVSILMRQPWPIKHARTACAAAPSPSSETRRRITESAVELHGTLGPVAHVDERRRRARRRAPLDALPPLPRRGRAVRRLHGALGGRQPAARPRSPGRRSPTRTSACAVALDELYAFYGRDRARCSRTCSATSRLPSSCASASAPSATTSTRRGTRCCAGRGAARRRAPAHARPRSATRSRSPPGDRWSREQGLGDRRGGRADVRARRRPRAEAPVARPAAARCRPPRSITFAPCRR